MIYKSLINVKRAALVLLGLVAAVSLQGQIEDGSFLEENIIITDMDGNEHDVFAMLDSGKTVVLDLFAEWCGPCWSYHNSGALESLYHQYGPEGTDELMVIAVETDASTPASVLTGGAGSSYGWNWAAGTSYPLANQNIGGIFEQAYYPYIIRICPNRQIYEVGQSSASSIYSQVNTCVSAQGDVNPTIIDYIGATESCGAIDLVVRFQNLGHQTLESSNFDVYVDGDLEMTAEWSGSLAPYGIEEFELGVLDFNQDVQLEIATGADDEFPDSYTTMINFGGPPSTNEVTVRVTLDGDPEETSWKIFDALGTEVAAGGPYQSSQAGTTIFTTVNLELGCHQFVLSDEAGDGFNGGNYFLFDSESTVISGGGGAGWTVISASFEVTSLVGIDNATPAGRVDIYPNPSQGQINLDLSPTQAQVLEMRVIDMTGKTVYRRDLGALPSGLTRKTVDLRDLNPGVYFVEIHAPEGDLRLGDKIVITQ